MAQTANLMQLGPETLHAFEVYARNAEEEMDRSLHRAQFFLWCDSEPRRAERMRVGTIPAEFWSGHGPLKVPGGLIHDWFTYRLSQVLKRRRLPYFFMTIPGEAIKNCDCCDATTLPELFDISQPLCTSVCVTRITPSAEHPPSPTAWSTPELPSSRAK